MDEPVRSGRQVKRLGGVGDRIAKRIDAFIANVPYDSRTRAKTTQKAERSCPFTDKGVRSQYVINALQLIPGIGKKRAETLRHKGCASLADLIKPEFLDLLTPAQQVCARFASCLNPVTLEEAESVYRFVSENISSKYEVVLHSSWTLFLPLKAGDWWLQVLQEVHKGGEASCGFQARVGGGEWEGRGERLSQINDQEGLYRKLGIFFVPKRYQGAARIVLTGDIKFVEDVCSRAHRLGLRFDEYGLWKWIEDEGKWEFLCGENEELIFRELGMDYVHPARRNFTHLLGERPRGRPKNGADDQSTISAGSGQHREVLVEPRSRKRGRPRKMPPQG
ncbi:hypothetical protein EV401DRAFT_1886523 [Pisolithus croceorrhizus]|nr:hypothetical protein EV401DRAFT_1886523 [Pisolithus croceorrhizus]